MDERSNESNREEENEIEGGLSVDDILSTMNPVGRFQLFLVSVIFLAVFSTSYNFMLVYFTADDPPWECTRGNSSHFCRVHKNKTIDRSSNLFEERCKLHRSEWTYIVEKQYSIVTEFDLVCENASVGAFATSAVYMGGIFGSLVSGLIADRYGRKKTIIVSIVITSVCAIGYTFVHNIWQFIALNIINGAGIVGTYFTAIVFLNELAPPKYRSLFSNIGLFGATTSFFVIDLIAYFIREWRLLVRVFSTSTIVASFLSFFLPESPRWLSAMGKNANAADVLFMMKKMNKDNKNDIINMKTVQMEHQENNYTYLDMFKKRKVIVLTLSVAFLWVIIPLVEYFIALESSGLGGNMYEAFAFSTIADAISVLICIYLCDRFGRKKTILGSVFSSGITVVIVGLIPRSVLHRYTINITLMALARVLVVTGFFGIYTWTLEIYPTVLRSQGMAVCAVSDRLGMFAVPYVVKLLVRVNHTLPYILIAILAIVASICGLVLPETNNRPTRERFEDFFEKKEAHNIKNVYDNSVASMSEEQSKGYL